MEINHIVKTIDDKSIWDEAVGGNLLQSWEYGEFWKSLGKNIWRVGVYEIEYNGAEKTETLKSVAQGLEVKTRFRSHIYVANGPVFIPDETKENLKTYFIYLIDFYKALAIKLGMKFIRFDPLFEENDENKEFMISLGMVQAAVHIQAETKWIINLKQTEIELMSSMNPDNRTKIRKAEKRGVKISILDKEDDFDKFWTLFEQTFKRNHFIPNSKSYYFNQFKSFLEAKQVEIVVAQNDQNQDLAAILLYYSGNTAYYLHAASADEKQLELNNAPKLAAWASIIQAKQRGCETYDFYGIARGENPKDPWFGFTRFKKAFGGFRRDMLRAYDYPINKGYRIVRFIEVTRNMWASPYVKIKDKSLKIKEWVGIALKSLLRKKESAKVVSEESSPQEAEK